MIDSTLLEILVCPETKQTVSFADAALLERLNAGIERGSVRNRGGESVSTPLEAALVREDSKVLYPVVEEIPVMLIDESIALDSLDG